MEKDDKSIERIVIVPGPALALDASSTWPEYRKTATVHAKQMEVPFEVETREGVVRGEPGDYLCGPGAEGEFWPVGKDIFESTYEALGDKETP